MHFMYAFDFMLTLSNFAFKCDEIVFDQVQLISNVLQYERKLFLLIFNIYRNYVQLWAWML